MLRLLLVPLLLAVSVSDVPNPRTTHGGWVSDTADQLSEADERLLEDKLSQLHAELGYEVAVVTVKTTPDTPKMFATELFNNWGIGNSARNDGLLVLLAMESRRLEMETGYGLESKLPDAWVVRMQREHMVPHFKTGNFGAGLLAGVEQVDRRLRGAPSGEASSTPGTSGTESSNQPVADLGSTRVANFDSGLPETKKQHWTYYVKTMDLKMLSRRMGPLGLLSLGLAIIFVFFLWARRRRLRAFKLCSSCGETRLILPEDEEDDHLSAGQEKEEELGSVEYDVWACPGCSSIAIDAKSAWFSSYSACPKCSRKTLKKTSKTIQAATTERSGSARVTEDCKNCKHSRTYTRTIPRVVESSSSSGSSYSWSSSSSSSSSYSSSSSSSSFGGGSSGGGGGGSSW